MHKHKNMVYFQGFTSFLNIVLNLILIPIYSLYGACYSSLISETFFALSLIIVGSKYLIWHFKDVFSMLVKPTLSGFASILLTIILLNKTNIFIQVLFLIICYFVLLFAIKTFNKKIRSCFLRFLKGEKILQRYKTTIMVQRQVHVQDVQHILALTIVL